MENTDLTRIQQAGINDYGLTIAQVQTPNYGAHTLEAIDRLQFDNEELGTQEAFDQVAGFNSSQLRGQLNYNLAQHEVLAPNFGGHSLIAIDHLRQLHPDTYPTNRTAFNLIRGLDEIQVNGVLYYNLTRAQVQSPNFNEQTLETIENLMRADQRRFRNPGIVFDEINSLNEIQVEGIRDYGLTRAQVTTPNFGAHTLDAMHHLTQGNAAQIEGMPAERLQRAAFDVVKGLNEIQTNALINFRLRGRHVLDDRLNENVLLNIQALNQQYPDARNEDLADIAMYQLQEYQVRGLNLGLSAEQLSFSIENNQLVNLENNTNPGKTVDAVSALVQLENITVQEAFQAAQPLNSEQTSALVNLGLGLAQVQNPAFAGNETIAEIYSSLENNEELGELDILLNQLQQEHARELMDEKIAAAQQQKELPQQNVASVASTATGDSEELASGAASDLSALTIAMNITDSQGAQASRKKETKPVKKTGLQKGYGPS